MAIKKTARAMRSAELTNSLNQVLADSYALLSLTHLAHWNVEGPGFFALHAAFQTQYEELRASNDAESQDLMIGRITLHQTTIWMLKSFLNG
jgi:DNA-binding ferritin-like protein